MLEEELQLSPAPTVSEESEPEAVVPAIETGVDVPPEGPVTEERDVSEPLPEGDDDDDYNDALPPPGDAASGEFLWGTVVACVATAAALVVA